MGHLWKRIKDKPKMGGFSYWGCERCGFKGWKTNVPQENQKVYLQHLKMKFTCEELILKKVMTT